MSWSKELGKVLVVALATLSPSRVHAQEGPGSVRVVVHAEDSPVAGAAVRSGTVESTTDSTGVATLRLAPGAQTIAVRKIGFAPSSARVTVAAGAALEVEIALVALAEEIEGIIVSSTRSERRIEDEPVRVEVLTQEEVEEKVMMTPGDITMMLNETSGLRVQNSSPSLGGASVRIQGLSGRYTQLLSDGLPLYGGQSGSLSMLQIPPMDLGQVEVIKGAASALYGSSALGGVVNLISRRPADERELLLNQSTLGGTDGVLWLGEELDERWGLTLLGGLHRQSAADVDEDGWADLPAYRRAVVRPRLFWDDGDGRSLFLTLGATAENREGGTVEGGRSPAGTRFPEELETRRGDAGLFGRFLLGESLLTVRASATAQRHSHLFGDASEQDAHATAFAEITYGGALGSHLWVAGAALQRESYRSEDVPAFDFTHTIPSLFAQDEYSPAEWLTLALSGRVDAHSEFGTFASPRLSALVRPGGWTVRGSVSTGYFAPTPFTEETEAVGLARVLPLGELRAERARSAALDVGRTLGALELNGTLFGSVVSHPLQASVEGDRIRLANADGRTRSWGGELLARWEAEPFHLTATYTHLRAREDDPEGPGRREVPLTPRHAAGLVGMWEAEGEGRVGIELYYTGRQRLDDNPYRHTSRPYLVTGLLVERRIGRARVFLNAENLLDARQTRHDPLVLPSRSPEGRWTTDAWAPLEGRAINGGVRLEI